MFFKDFVSVKRQKIKRGASQTYDTPSSSSYGGDELTTAHMVAHLHTLLLDGSAHREAEAYAKT